MALPSRTAHDQQAARSMVPVRTAVPVRAVVRKRIAGPFGSPTVLSGCAVRTCCPDVLSGPSASSGLPPPGFRRVLS